MITLVFANQKGGTGKSAHACQYAYSLVDFHKKRVLVIDFDHQGNTSKAIGLSGMATVAALPASAFLLAENPLGRDALPSGADFVLLRADEDLKKLEKQPDLHNRFATNLKAFIEAVANDFDVCVIDTNPNPDIRMIGALVVADHVVSPVQLNQEALDGIGALKQDIAKIKARLNPKLNLIGIVPNLVQNTPFQRDNFAQLVQHFSSILVPTKTAKGPAYAAISIRTAIAEAQAAGKPVWKLGKTSARDAWVEMKPTYDAINAAMGVV